MHIFSKYKCYTIALVSLWILPTALSAQSIETTPSSDLVYDSQNLKAHQQDLDEIYFEMGKYYQGVEEAQLNLLSEVFHKAWHMRDDDTEEGELNVESKNQFISRVRNHGVYPEYAAHRTFAEATVLNENLAFVRIDKTTSGNSTNFFLIKQQEQWRILDKLWVTAANQPPPEEDVYASISALLQRYLQAIKDGDRHTLSQFMHHQWNLMEIDAQGMLHMVTLGDFFDGNASRYTKATPSSINIFQNKLAIVRLDWGVEGRTSFLIFYKIKEQWLLAGERSSTADNSP